MKRIKINKKIILNSVTLDDLTIINIGFGRNKGTKGIQTQTIYDSLDERTGDMSTEIWLDKQNGQAIGIEIFLRDVKEISNDERKKGTDTGYPVVA